MTQSLLDKNLECISRYNRELAQKIANITELEGNYEIKNAKSGDSVLYKDGLPLDDTIDPVWRAMEDYKKIKFKIKRSITFILGFGLGYALKEFAKKHAGKIIIYEPDINTLRIVFEIVDYSEELQKNNIRIVSDYKELENAYHAFFFVEHRLNVMCSDYYFDNHSATTLEIKKKLEDLHSIFQSNYNNLFDKNYYWTDLLFKNIPSIVNKHDLHELKDKFKNKTAVIISAGPSLDKNIEDLKPYRDRMVVFCVGTALKAAVKHGIIPDFAVAVETNYNTYVQLNLPEVRDMNLIISTKTYPEIYRLKARRIFNYFGLNTPASKWLGQLLEVPVELYREAGTVSLTAFYSAKLLGCDKIIFIGQDLAYTDNKCYSQDSLYGIYKVNESKTISAENADSLKNALSVTNSVIEHHAKSLSNNMVYVKAQDGGKVLTRVDMVLFIKYFEDVAREFGSELKLVNATEGGAYLEGFEHITLKSALEQYTADTVVAENILKTLNKKSQKVAQKRRILLENLGNIVKNHNKGWEIIEKTYENQVKSVYTLDFEKFANYIAENQICSRLIRLNGIIRSATEEEKEIFKKFKELNQANKQRLKEQIKELYNKSPDKFAQNLAILKENFIKLDKIYSQNPFIHNRYIFMFMLGNNLLRDYEGWEDCLVCLSYFLSDTIIEMHYRLPEDMNLIIKNTINELERQK